MRTLMSRLHSRYLLRRYLRHGVRGLEYAAPDKKLAAEIGLMAEEAIETGNFELAGELSLTALRHLPNSGELARRSLKCASRLARDGIDPPALSRHGAAASGKISLIVCSNDEQRYARFLEHATQKFAGEDWEIIRIPDAASMNEGYRRGLGSCAGELVVLCHDDIGFLCNDPADRLRYALGKADMVGVAGTDRLVSAAWWSAGPPHLHSWVSRPLSRGGFSVGVLGAESSFVPGAQALDGMLIAAHGPVLEKLGFDTETFDGFHFYDLDLSWRAFKEGLRIGIALDLSTWHRSGGNFNDVWSQYAGRFEQKHREFAGKNGVPSLSVPYVEVATEDHARRTLSWYAYWAGRRGIRA